MCLMPKRKRKQKPKRKPDALRTAQQIEGCIHALFRVIALIVLWFCLMSIGVIVYIATLYPAFDPTIWIALSGFFAYLSSYFAFASDDEDEKRKNDDIDE